MGKQAAKASKKQDDAAAMEALAVQSGGKLPDKEALAAALNLTPEEAERVLQSAARELEPLPVAEQPVPTKGKRKAAAKPKEKAVAKAPKADPKQKAKAKAKAASPAKPCSEDLEAASEPPPAALVPLPPQAPEEAQAALVALDPEVPETQVDAGLITPRSQTRAPASPFPVSPAPAKASAASDGTKHYSPGVPAGAKSQEFLKNWVAKPKLPRQVVLEDDGEDSQCEPEAMSCRMHAVALRAHTRIMSAANVPACAG